MYPDEPGECARKAAMILVAFHTIGTVKRTFERLQQQQVLNDVASEICKKLFCETYCQYNFECEPLTGPNDPRIAVMYEEMLPANCKAMFESSALFCGWK